MKEQETLQQRMKKFRKDRELEFKTNKENIYFRLWYISCHFIILIHRN